MGKVIRDDGDIVEHHSSQRFLLSVVLQKDPLKGVAETSAVRRRRDIGDRVQKSRLDESRAHLFGVRSGDEGPVLPLSLKRSVGLSRLVSLVFARSRCFGADSDAAAEQEGILKVRWRREGIGRRRRRFGRAIERREITKVFVAALRQPKAVVRSRRRRQNDFRRFFGRDIVPKTVRRNDDRVNLIEKKREIKSSKRKGKGKRKGHSDED